MMRRSPCAPPDPGSACAAASRPIPHSPHSRTGVLPAGAHPPAKAHAGLEPSEGRAGSSHVVAERVARSEAGETAEVAVDGPQLADAVGGAEAGDPRVVDEGAGHPALGEQAAQ